VAGQPRLRRRSTTLRADATHETWTAALLSFRFLDHRKVFKLVRERCPAMGNVLIQPIAGFFPETNARTKKGPILERPQCNSALRFSISARAAFQPLFGEGIEPML
jgi:hypothetical protein